MQLHRLTPRRAAELALHTDPVPYTETRRRILDAAAVLWCRELGLPTVRGVAAAVGMAPVSVLHPWERFDLLLAEVVRRELRALQAGWYGAAREERDGWLRRHCRALRQIDADLLRLPALVHAAVVAAEAPRVVSVDARPEVAAPLFIVASLPGGPAGEVDGWTAAVSSVRA